MASGEGARETAEALARRSYGKLVAFLTVRTGDVAGAEDALSDAFAAALADWPVRGVPENPEAWLIAVARRKRIDAARRRASGAAAAGHLQLIAEELEVAAATEVQIPDERLALMFACAHPAIDAAVRAPLILQTVLGFDAATIGSAFLLSPATMGQRLVRAKQKIKQAGIPFRVPERAELGERLDAVLEAIYAVFAEGWSDPAGTDSRRGNLGAEGIWLGRLVASLLPQQPEALGLLALMLHAEARRGARRSARGDYGTPGISTGRRSSASMRSSTRSRVRRWWRSTGPSRSPRRAAPPPGLRRSTICRAMRGSANISRIGRRAPDCWREPATSMRPSRPTSGRSASNPTRPCAASCSSAARNCADNESYNRSPHAAERNAGMAFPDFAPASLALHPGYGARAEIVGWAKRSVPTISDGNQVSGDRKKPALVADI